MARIAVWGGKDPVGVAERVMRRFGLDSRLEAVARGEIALERARVGGLAVAALEPAGAWCARLAAEPKVRAFDLIAGSGAPILCLTEVVQEPTGSDAALWITDAPASAAAIEARLGEIGFGGELVWSGPGLKLFALAGYVQRHDPRLAAAPGRLTGIIGIVPETSVQLQPQTA